MSAFPQIDGKQVALATAQTTYGTRIRNSAQALINEADKSVDHYSAVQAYVQQVVDTLGLTIT